MSTACHSVGTCACTPACARSDSPSSHRVPGTWAVQSSGRRTCFLPGAASCVPRGTPFAEDSCVRGDPYLRREWKLGCSHHSPRVTVFEIPGVVNVVVSDSLATAHPPNRETCRSEFRNCPGIHLHFPVHQVAFVVALVKRLSKGLFAHEGPSRVQDLSAAAVSEAMAGLAADGILESVDSVLVQEWWVASA